MRLHPADNPESVRVRKYLTGTHLALAAGGVAVGTAPALRTWRHGPATLTAYRGAHRHAVPVLLVYPLLLRPFLLDLVPGRSLVRHLGDHGFRVYLLHWDGASGRRRTLDAYLADDLPWATQMVREHGGEEELSLVGHCQAGTFAAIHAAREPSTVRNLVLYAAPVQGAPISPPRQALPMPDWLVPTLPLDRVTRLAGTLARTQLRVPGARTFGDRMRDRLLRSPEGRVWLAACRWVDESGPLPGPASAQWMRALYRDNAVARGSMTVAGEKVTLEVVTAAVLTIAGRWDAIAPPFQAAVARHFPNAREFVRLDVPAGHVGVHVGPTAPDIAWRPLTDWLAARS
jgi:polyhydroxyalkanoate synthase